MARRVAVVVRHGHACGSSWPDLRFVMAGLNPAIARPRQFVNDAIPISNHCMEMTAHAVSQQFRHLVRESSHIAHHRSARYSMNSVPLCLCGESIVPTDAKVAAIVSSARNLHHRGTEQTHRITTNTNASRRLAYIPATAF